jgi:UDP-N-acetyl-D-galactosamine dehydrogenase
MNNYNIAIIGLGYVGLPLAVNFSKKYRTVGYDVNKKRVNELKSNIDITGEVTSSTLKKNQKDKLLLTENDNEISDSNVFIITVPTPIFKNKKPNLEPLISATELVANKLKYNDIVIYESTVFPGTTEEICVPIIENISKLKYNSDFYVGYSPERINPGDKKHTLQNIIKITSGSNKNVAKKIDQLYNEIIEAGTYLAPSIKIAEAAKVIENAQRDINIAFVNELSKIFSLLQIDTLEVLKAANTKWNFMDFKPGLVGGHCIGVDPYYLAYKSELEGYKPEVILSGRQVNDSMSKFIFDEVIKIMDSKNIDIGKSNLLILGFTFKENCNDYRNTKVLDLYKYLINYKINVEIFDPLVESEAVKKDLNISILSTLPQKNMMQS